MLARARVQTIIHTLIAGDAFGGVRAAFARCPRAYAATIRLRIHANPPSQSMRTDKPGSRFKKNAIIRYKPELIGHITARTYTSRTNARIQNPLN